MGLLLGHTWPGNVRELENAMERAVVLSPSPEPEAPSISQPCARRRRARPTGSEGPLEVRIPGSTLARLEREAILRTLEAVQGSTSRAAAILDISPRKIQYKLKEYQREGALAPPPQ